MPVFFRIAEIMNKDVCNYVEGTRRIPTEYSSLLRNVQNRFRSKSKKKESENQELDEFGTRWDSLGYATVTIGSVSVGFRSFFGSRRTYS